MLDSVAAGLVREKSRPLRSTCVCSDEINQFAVDILFTACKEETIHEAGAPMSETSKGTSPRSFSSDVTVSATISGSPGHRLAVFAVISVV